MKRAPELKTGSLSRSRAGTPLTQPHAAVLQQVAQVVEHGLLVLAADAAEVAQEAAAAGHHLGEGDLLQTRTRAGGAGRPIVSANRVRKTGTIY